MRFPRGQASEMRTELTRSARSCTLTVWSRSTRQCPRRWFCIGGTGIPEEDIQRAIRGGINKVNVGTQLHYTYLKALQDYLKADDFKPNVLNAMLSVVEAIKEPVRKWIKVCMADQKA